LGGPRSDNEFAVGVGGTTSEGNRGGVAFGQANIDGPLAFTATIGAAEEAEDTTAWVAGGTLAYDAPLSFIAGCATAGFTHASWSGTIGDGSVLAFPAGVSAGRRLVALGTVDVVPWVRLGALYSRVKEPESSGTPSRANANMGAFLNGGASLGIGGLVARVGVFVATVDRPATTYSVEVGWMWTPAETAAEFRRGLPR
jgi:hypothetical protein